MKPFRRRGSGSASAPPLLPDKALSWLLGALLAAMLPHVGHLPLWLSGFFIAAIGWRWLAARNGRRLPGVLLRTALVLAVVGALLAQYGTLLGREAGIGLLTSMAALKALEGRTVRDGMVLVFLGFFLLMAGLLNNQTMAMACYLVGVVVLLLTAQTWISPQHHRLQSFDGLKLSASLVLQAVPIMILLFVLFPRIPGPLWGLPRDAYSGLTGLSDSMTPGSISELTQSAEVAFRVKFSGASPRPEQMYWRGPVLWWLRNRTWFGNEEALQRELPYLPLEQRIDYTVTLEAHGRHSLFALDLPALVPPGAGLTRTFQLKQPKPVEQRIKYQLSSYMSYSSGNLTATERRRYLQLPHAGNARARRLAEGWREQLGETGGIISAALQQFRQQAFYYTLSPPLLGENNIDEFLFDSRRGFCEHYAGSFVYLMRAAGIPARVVTGYQGGEPNGDYYIVRQSDAHAWAEVWQQGGGWRRVDPTAAVAPERIERGLFAAIDEADTLPLLARGDSNLLRSLALGWDSVNNAWNQWILGYNTERQRDVLSGLGAGEMAWREMMLTLVTVLSGVGLIAAALLGLRRSRRGDPLARIYRRFCSRLAKIDLDRRPNEGPLDYADRVADSRPDLAADTVNIARLYALLRFGQNGDNNAGQKRLARLVADFRPRSA